MLGVDEAVFKERVEYEKVKEKFIELSKAVHLRGVPYDSAFQLAADAVREVFKVEPINSGPKRSAFESKSTRALVGIMKSQTDICDYRLARFMKKKDNTSMYQNFRQHESSYEKESEYRVMYNQALVNYIQSNKNQIK